MNEIGKIDQISYYKLKDNSFIYDEEDNLFYEENKHRRNIIE